MFGIRRAGKRLTEKRLPITVKSNITTLLEKQAETLRRYPNVKWVVVKEHGRIAVCIKNVKICQELETEVEVMFNFNFESPIGYYNSGFIETLESSAVLNTPGIDSYLLNGVYKAGDFFSAYTNGHPYLCFGGGLWTLGMQDALTRRDVQSALSTFIHFMQQHKGNQFGGSRLSLGSTISTLKGKEYYEDH